MVLGKLVEDGTHLIPLNEWKECIKHGIFVPDDGYGVWVSGDSYLYEYSDPRNNVFKEPPKEATHVAWFSK